MESFLSSVSLLSCVFVVWVCLLVGLVNFGVFRRWLLDAEVATGFDNILDKLSEAGEAGSRVRGD